MKTKLFTLLLTIVASVGTMFAWDYERVQIGDLYYNLDATNHTAEVAANRSASGTVVIPSSVTYNSVSYSVTSIGYSTFSGCSGLTSIEIPNSVTSIGKNAFYKCSGLTSVTIPNSVTSIEDGVFEGCSGLTSVTIPNSVTSIGSGAFWGCSGLTSLTIPNSVTSIGEWAFSGCTGLTSPVYNAHVFAFMPTSYSGAYTIPDGIESIAGAAFCECSGLTSVTIPNSVTSIGSGAFVECTGLTSPVYNTHVFAYMPTSYSGAYTIPYGIESIAGGAFSGCSGLTSLTIPNSVTSIGSGAFWGCSGLTSVTIGNSVTSIGERAFYLCSGLTSVTIPNSVTSIGELAFASCRVLTSVTIPNSVTSIGDYAFRYCSGLTSVTIGNSVTSIGDYAFSECTGLTSVTIPNSVTNIGNYAFVECTGLTSVTIEAETPSWGSVAFNNTNNCPIYVPCGTLDAYKTELSEYASRIQYVPLEYHITGNVNIEGSGNVQLPQNKCEDVISAAPNYGYHFTQWSDGVKDNPRTIVLTQDTTFTAEFAKNTYTISTISANPEWGTTAGDKAALYLDVVEITATPNYGYHFVKWNDNNTSNPRMVSVTEDKTYTATFAKNVYSITKNAEHGSISGDTSAEYLDEVTLTANPKYGYHFAQWSDGKTDNPRTIVLTQDTTFTAEFAKNIYTISTTSANPEWGITAGGKSALYLDEVEISATANYGYHFVKWNDNNTSNPRMVSVTEDKTYTATFAKKIYSITKNAEHGSIVGNSSAEYLDFVTLTVTADYGYHFTQWSDGLKDNPRIAQITQDTTFMAEFAYDRVGTCGKDLALVWSYDPTNKVLTIGNAGSFTENMRFGVEAPNEMEELVIGNNVTAIGENAFAGISTLKKVSIGESVKTIGEQAFYNCVNLETIFNYRPTPTNTYSNAFDGVDKFECVLYVLPNSIDMYKAAAVWRDFYYTYAIGAEETTVTTNDVQVEPQDNAATLTWPTSVNAATYTIQITKDGVLFCTLIFNANGQLTGIAFAPGKNGNRHAPAAKMTANGLQFTVTGLNSNTQYGYNLTAKDANDQTVATYSGSFTTTSEGAATGVDNVQGDKVQSTKFLRNGQIYILRGEKVYTLQGQKVK